jgi:hypothetical protein
MTNISGSTTIVCGILRRDEFCSSSGHAKKPIFSGLRLTVTLAVSCDDIYHRPQKVLI